MTEEEIKIIEDFLNYNTNKQISGIEINAISKLLNCYYKQQKEIECLNVIHESYKEMIEENNYISKDKIKEKLKKYSEKEECTYKELIDFVEEIKELLEE